MVRAGHRSTEDAIAVRAGRAGRAIRIAWARITWAGPVLGVALALCAAPVRAQTVSCSKFLHNRDGSWSSFVTGEVLGSRGPVPIHAGERFSRNGRGAGADLARTLDALCRSD